MWASRDCQHSVACVRGLGSLRGATVLVLRCCDRVGVAPTGLWCFHPSSVPSCIRTDQTISRPAWLSHGRVRRITVALAGTYGRASFHGCFCWGEAPLGRLVVVTHTHLFPGALCSVLPCLAWSGFSPIAGEWTSPTGLHGLSGVCWCPISRARRVSSTSRRGDRTTTGRSMCCTCTASVHVLTLTGQCRLYHGLANQTPGTSRALHATSLRSSR